MTSRFGKGRLKALNLADIGTVTDAALMRIAAGCPRLEALDLSHGGDAVTDAGVIGLGGLRDLRSINVSNCSAVTDTSIATLLRQCPHMTPTTLKADSEATQGMQYQTALIERRHSMQIFNPN